MLEEKMQSSCHTYDNQDESDIHFPISTLTELTTFEDQLQEIKFKDKIVCDEDSLFFLYYYSCYYRLCFLYRVISQFNIFYLITFLNS